MNQQPSTFRLSERTRQIAPSATVALVSRVQELRAQGKDVVSFGIGQPDFATPEPIREAAARAMNAGHTGYTPALGEKALREAVCGQLKRDLELDYSPDQIATGSGGKGVLAQLFQCLVNPGDEVILLAPYWVSYPVQIELAGGKAVVVGAHPDTLKPDLESLAGLITPRTTGLVINSPNNPGGNVYSREDLEALGKIAIDHDLWIISDEVYQHFYFDQQPLSIAQLFPALRQRTIIVNAVSKTYSMTGWRLGYAASEDRALIKAMGRLQSHNLGNPSSISQWAAVAAYTGDQSSVGEMREAFRRRRDLMMGCLDQIEQLTCLPPEGAFYVFPRVIGFEDTDELAMRLLEEAGVAVVPGGPFGMPQHIRLSYALADDQLAKGMVRVVEWFGRL